MDPSKLLRTSHDTKVEWNTTHCILPIAYYPLHTTEYTTVILASDWLYFSRHGIKNDITLFASTRHIFNVHVSKIYYYRMVHIQHVQYTLYIQDTLF